MQDKTKAHDRSQTAFGSAKGGKHGWEGPKAVLVGKMEHILLRKNGALQPLSWQTYTNSGQALTITLVIDLTINQHLSIAVTINLDPAPSSKSKPNYDPNTKLSLKSSSNTDTKLT